MAPLSRPDDRGQLLLVTGLGLAALVVVLALVLNSAIYTENYASREVDSVDTVDVLRFEHDAATVAADAVRVENADGTTDYATMHANLTRHVDTWSDLTARHAAVDARAVSAELVATTNGTRVVQADARAMTNVAGDANWTVADDATRVGRFTATVDRSALVDTPDDTNATTLARDGVYAIVLDDGTTVRAVYVYATNGNQVTVRVADETGTLGPACTATATGGEVTIDLVAGTLDGADCGGFGLEAVTGAFSLEFREGDAAAGTYDLVVDDEAIDGDVADYAVTGDTTGPYGMRVVYDATLSLRYVTPDLTYADTVRVSGGDWP